MILKSIEVGPFRANCYLLACEHTGEGLLIDPGNEDVKILAMVQQASVEHGIQIEIRTLLMTHGHLDHISAVRSVKETFAKTQKNPPEIRLHSLDQNMYQMLQAQSVAFGLKASKPLPIDRGLEDNEKWMLGQLEIRILHTPGHSPGGVCILSGDRLFSGDTLFAQNIGRTDLQGGDSEALIRSIKNKLFTLPDSTRVYSGHGEETTIGAEKRSNPYLQ